MEDKIIIKEEDRFSRFEIIKWWDQKKLSQAKIMVVGAGALGNEVLKNLALYGIGYVYLIDFDKIEISNLSRSVLFKETDIGRYKAEVAAERLKEIYPQLKVIWSNKNVVYDIGLGTFKEMDIIIGCIDNREARLYLNRYAWKVKKPWIDGGIQELMGTFAVYNPNDNTACYECTLTDIDYQLLNIRYSCPLLKREDILEGKSPTTPTISSIIAGFQVQEAIKLLHNIKVESGVLYFINGVTNLFDYIKFSVKEDCLSHISYEPIYEINEKSENLKIKDLINYGKDILKTSDIYLNLDRDIITKFICPNCHKEEIVNKQLNKVSIKQETCPNCGSKRKFIAKNIIYESDEIVDYNLLELDLPKFHIYELRNSENSIYIEIRGDKEEVLNFN